MASDVSAMSDRALLELVCEHCQHVKAALDTIIMDKMLIQQKHKTQASSPEKKTSFAPSVADADDSDEPPPGTDDDDDDDDKLVEVCFDEFVLGSSSSSLAVLESDDEAKKKDAVHLARKMSMVSAGWPQNVQVREFIPSSLAFVSTTSTLESVSDSLGRRAMHSVTSLIQAPEQSKSRKCVLKPSSWQRVCFDSVGVLVLLIDLFLTPVVLAWDLPQVGFVFVFTVSAVVFWTADCALNFRTGFFQRTGELEMRPIAIMCSYAKSTLLVDLLVLAMDWLTVLATLFSAHGGSGSSLLGIRLFRFAKASRLLRVAVFLRMANVSHYMERLGYAIPEMNTVIHILKIVVVIMWINHIVCCSWYGIGATMGEVDTGRSWLSVSMRDHDDGSSFADMGALYQYTTAYHWALTQMTPGSMEIVPRNSAERIFNIFSLIFGMLFFSGLVSTLSASIIGIRMRYSEANTKMATLRRFLHESGISAELSMSIQRQAQQRLTTPKPLLLTDVSAIEVLSQSMRAELIFQLCHPHILQHGLFHSFWSLDRYKFKEVLEGCIDFCFMNLSDVFFRPGEFANHAYYLESGALSYVPVWSSDTDGNMDLVDHKEMICEAALWTEWAHVGTLKATEATIMISIDVSKHADACSGASDLFHKLASEYSQLYQQRLISASLQAWPSDIKVSFTTFNEIILASSSYMRQVVSLAFLESLKSRSFGFDFTGNAKLQNEVCQDKCVLTFHGKRSIERLLAISVLELSVGPSILTEVATWTAETGLEVSCKLPGRKRIAGESYSAPLERLLANELKFLQRYVNLTQAEVSVDEDRMVSETYKIPTTYIRTICHVQLEQIPTTELMWLEAKPGEDTCVPYNVFVIHKDGRLVLYAFLPRREVELYRRKPEERFELIFLLSKFELDESVVRRAKDWGLRVTALAE